MGREKLFIVLAGAVILTGCLGTNTNNKNNENDTKKDGKIEATVGPEETSTPEDTASLENSEETTTKKEQEQSNKKKIDSFYGTGYTNYKEAYADYIRKECTDDPDDLGRNFKYSFINLDDDDIPEMTIETTYEATGEKIVSFKDGELHHLLLSRIGTEYIFKEGLFAHYGMHMGYNPVTIYKYEDGEFYQIGFGVSQEYAATDGTDEYYYKYTWNDEVCLEEDYNNHINALFDSSKAETPKESFSKDEMLKKLGN